MSHFHWAMRTFFRWKEKGMPILPDGRFDLVQIALWLDRRKKKKEKVASVDPQKEELARHARIRADHAELKFRQARGELVAVAEVESMFAARALVYRQGIVGFSRSLPPLLIDCRTEREMEAVIIKVGRELLENVLRALPEKFRIGDHGDDTQDILPPGAGENTTSCEGSE
ncbi:MAG: hypothetical protein ACYDHF_06305 [Candidatus Cryosericum sp.]